MQGLSEQQLLLLLITLGGLILLGRAAGALARRVQQPEVLGQLLAGVLVGPSVFGTLLPTPAWSGDEPPREAAIETRIQTTTSLATPTARVTWA